jgi:hypothetical protein
VEGPSVRLLSPVQEREEGGVAYLGDLVLKDAALRVRLAPLGCGLELLEGGELGYTGRAEIAGNGVHPCGVIVDMECWGDFDDRHQRDFHQCSGRDHSNSAAQVEFLVRRQSGNGWVDKQNLAAVRHA